MFVTCCVFSVVCLLVLCLVWCALLSSVRYVSCVVCCAAFVVYWLVLFGSCVVFAVCGMMFVVCWLLFGVACCVPFVVVWLCGG